MAKRRAVIYYDGSNFYHLANSNFNITSVDYVNLSKDILGSDELIKIKYFNAPVNRQEDPNGATAQQKFFAHLQKQPEVEIILGKLVRRSLGKIVVQCKKCGLGAAKDVNCPKCAKLIDLSTSYKDVEKGVDVRIAMTILLDAINDSYDVAYLVSSDADFVPVIEYVRKHFKKEVIYCHFPTPFTSDLVRSCSRTQLMDYHLIDKHRVP